MVVRADNVAYGTKACQFLGTKLGGKHSVVMLEGDVASINGRDRTDAFSSCMSKNFPGIKVHAEPSKWDAATAASQLATVLEQDNDVRGVYMESSFALAGTLQALNSKGLLVAPTDPKHVFVVSNDGIAEELKDIARRQDRRDRFAAGRPVRLLRAVLRQGSAPRQDVQARTDRPQQHHHSGARRRS